MMENKRKYIVAGNWKMNTTPIEGAKLIKSIIAVKKGVSPSIQFIVAPPFTHLSEAVKLTRGTGIAVAAQNCADQASGAYTGEVSAQMISSLGVEYVILGHSERRQYYGDTAQVINRKMELALSNNLLPIYCIGESLDEREAGRHFEVVKRQLDQVVLSLSSQQLARITIAYEPVWAIGTGKTATAEQAEEIHAYIREVLTQKFGKLADSITILYGGSANPTNADQLFAKPNIDGGLIGGASLKANDFITIGTALASAK